MVANAEGDTASDGVPPNTDMVPLAEEVMVDSHDDEITSDCIEDAVVLTVWDTEADQIAVRDAIDGEARSEVVPIDWDARLLIDRVAMDEVDGSVDCDAASDTSLEIEDDTEGVVDSDTQEEGDAMSEADVSDAVALDVTVWVKTVVGDGAPDGDTFSVAIGVAEDDTVDTDVIEAVADIVVVSLDVPPNTDIVAFTESVGVAPEEEDAVTDCSALIDAMKVKESDSESNALGDKTVEGDLMSEAEFRTDGDTSMVTVPVAAGENDTDVDRTELGEGKRDNDIDADIVASDGDGDGPLVLVSEKNEVSEPEALKNVDDVTLGVLEIVTEVVEVTKDERVSLKVPDTVIETTPDGDNRAELVRLALRIEVTVSLFDGGRVGGFVEPADAEYETVIFGEGDKVALEQTETFGVDEEEAAPDIV